MEKNIAALLREDTKTVGVRFFSDRKWDDSTLVSLDLGTTQDLSAKTYTYITTLDLQVQDLAVVFVSGMPKVVLVVRVDDICNINPQDNVEYKWIVSKVDVAAYYADAIKNKLILETVAEAYKKNLRGQFQDIVMKNLGRSDKLKLKNILKS